MEKHNFELFSKFREILESVSIFGVDHLGKSKVKFQKYIPGIQPNHGQGDLGSNHRGYIDHRHTWLRWI